MKKIHIFSSSELRNIPIKENNEEVVDLENLGKYIAFDLADYLSISEKDKALLVRKSVAEMLIQASILLSPDYKIIFLCGYRTPDVQKYLYKKIEREIIADNPTWERAQIENRLDECVAPLDLAPHCTGGAVDVFLGNKRGGFVDIGCKVDELSERTFTYSEAITEKQKNNRKIFINALSQVGLCNFPGEVWHWSYGERDWAAYTKQKCAFYDVIAL